MHISAVLTCGSCMQSLHVYVHHCSTYTRMQLISLWLKLLHLKLSVVLSSHVARIFTVHSVDIRSSHIHNTVLQNPLCAPDPNVNRRNLFTKQIIIRNYWCFSICFQKTTQRHKHAQTHNREETAWL